MVTPLWRKIIRAFLCPDEVLHIFNFGSDADRWQGIQHSFMVSLSGSGTVVQDADHAGVGFRVSSILYYMIGQRFRQENFGSKLWQCIEEPNSQTIRCARLRRNSNSSSSRMAFIALYQRMSTLIFTSPLLKGSEWWYYSCLLYTS